MKTKSHKSIASNWGLQIKITVRYCLPTVRIGKNKIKTKKCNQGAEKSEPWHSMAGEYIAHSLCLAAVFPAGRILSQPQCPLVDDQRRKMWHEHTAGCSAMKL